MPFIKELKKKILNNSDTYNYYKDYSLYIGKELKDLKKELKDLKKEFKDYKKNNGRINRSNNEFFNRLFLDFELKPRGALKLTQELCLELLDFYVNVCNKHDLQFWLDYGNLLGAVRHGGYIPWDEDMDVGMMREDCMRFNEIFEDEIKLYNLEDVISLSKQRVTTPTDLRCFSQIKILKKNMQNRNLLYACVDVFPCDYIINPPQTIEEDYKNAKVEYYNNIYNKMSKEEVVNNLYNNLNCSFEEQEYYLPCIEGPFGKGRYKFNLFRSDKLFPLEEIEFNGRVYPAPNDINDYLTRIYGKDYMKIPKTITVHRRLNDLRKVENLEENYAYFLKRLKEVNEEF